MLPLLSQCLIFAGILILTGALVRVRRLMPRLPLGSMRNRWRVLMALIMVFIAGYLAYALAFWNSASSLRDLIVPGVFFLGACFVWLTATLSLQTAMDVLRVSHLERETLLDPLTGVFNRRHLDRRLSEEIAHAARHGLPLSVLLFDIDHFKLINDTHGHQAGDQVLVAVLALAAEELREADILARYGGDEFLVVTPHTTLQGVADLAERLRNRIASHLFTFSSATGETREITVTISVGVASFNAVLASREQLVPTADANLYRAKQLGRNRVVVGAPAECIQPARAIRQQMFGAITITKQLWTRTGAF